MPSAVLICVCGFLAGCGDNSSKSMVAAGTNAETSAPTTCRSGSTVVERKSANPHIAYSSGPRSHAVPSGIARLTVLLGTDGPSCTLAGAPRIEEEQDGRWIPVADAAGNLITDRREVQAVTVDATPAAAVDLAWTVPGESKSALGATSSPLATRFRLLFGDLPIMLNDGFEHWNGDSAEASPIYEYPAPDRGRDPGPQPPVPAASPPRR